MAERAVGELFSEAQDFPEVLSTVTDPNLASVRVTTDFSASGDARGLLFTPDSRRALFKRHRSVGQDSWTEYTLCEIEDSFKLRVLTSERTARAPVISADGRCLWYFVDETAARKPRVVLKRISLEDFAAEVVTVFDSPVRGIGKAPAAAMSGGASLRSDGKVLCTGFNFSADPEETHFAPVFVNLETLEIHGWDWEPYSWRVGGAYFPGSDPAHLRHLLMARCNRSQHWDKTGKYSEKWYSDVHRAVLHVVDEEGSIVGTVPVGGEGEGVDHPYWRGGRYEVVIHSSDFNTARHWRGAILCAEPIDCPPEQRCLGKDIPGARRFDMTRRVRRPDVCHMSWHVGGTRAVCDTEGWLGRDEHGHSGLPAYLYLVTVVEPRGEDPYVVPKFLLLPRSSWNWALTENCPELSPDCRTVFYNTDFCSEGHRPQVCAVQGFAFP